MSELEVFLNNLQIEKEYQEKEAIRLRNSRLDELEDFQQQINKLKDEKQLYIETINKNLTLITSNKKSLQKVVEETVEEHGLPISSACRTKALNFFSTAAKFINDSQKYNFYSGENAKDVTEIAELLQLSNENSIKEISNFKNKVEEIRSVNQCSRLLNDYSSLQGSQGEKSQLDESIFD